MSQRASEPRTDASSAWPSGRWWPIYALAWLPYLGLYFLAFAASGEFGPTAAVLAAFLNVLPPALLGLGVVQVCRRLSWRTMPRLGFFASHAGIATVYAGLSSFTTASLIIVHMRMQQPDFDWTQYHRGILVWQFYYGLLMYVTLAAVIYAVEFVARLREQEARAARAEALKSEAELAALRARLNPHFLFNTLHSVLALVRHDAEAAEEALEQFGDLLHYALRMQRDSTDEVSLAEEWQFVRNYLAIEKLRLGDRLRLTTEVQDEALGCRVPAFSLQPLVENAIRHAIAPRAEGGRLTVTAGRDDHGLRLEVRDDGPGAEDDRLEADGGLGLRLVRERLEVLYGAEARFEVETAPGRGFVAVVRLPLREARVE